MAVLDVRLMGPIEVVAAGGSIPLPATKVRLLLGILALDANTKLSSAALTDRLWSGVPPTSAASVLRTYVTQLRRALPDGSGRLERVDDGYLLRLDADELDVSRFDAAIAAASTPDVAPADAARLLQDALSLWRGPPLVELADDARGVAEAARLQARRWAAVEALADAHLALGRHEGVVSDLTAAVREEPLREQLVSRLMVALYRCGCQAEALAEYQRLRRALRDELGLDPSEDVRAVQDAILSHDPSLQAPVARRGNLPSSLTTFVGRRDEAEHLAEMLTAQRLVTLVGVGGAGKTRLALELGQRLRDAGAHRWPDGVWLVELAPRRAESELVPAVLGAMGLAQDADRTPLLTLVDALRDRRLLLLLDNCEHLRAASGELVAALLRATPGVTVLATSRAPLGVPGELVWRVAPLQVPEPGDDEERVRSSAAGTLLAHRISSARGGRGPQADEWSAVASLCRDLDGLPLAIELIASRAGVVSVADLARDVGRHLLEVQGTLTGPEHHHSLVACVAWSDRLLDADQRRMLHAVSVLPGSFSADAAAAVAAVANDEVAMTRLGALASQSLLEPVAGPRSRFRMLESVRDVVRADLPPEQVELALDRLVGWAAAWAEAREPQLRGPAAPQALDELEQELPVLHLALEHGLSRPVPDDAVRVAAAISGVWAHRGYLVDGRKWLARAVSASAQVAPALRARLLLAAGTHAVTLGDVDGMRRHVEAALALARGAADPADVIRALLWAARSATLQSAHEAAVGLYCEALDLAKAGGDEASAASALAGLGDVAAARGELQVASSFHLRSLAAFRSAGDLHGQGQALLNLAETDRRAGLADDAAARLDEAVGVFAAIADRSCTAACIEAQALLAHDGGRLEAAEALYRDAVAVRRELQQDRLLAVTLTKLAAVIADAGRPEEAAVTLGTAGVDTGALTERLRAQLGDRGYLSAWADGRLDAAST